MTTLVSQIAWSDPILPEVPDPQWSAEVKRRAGKVSQPLMRVARSPWLRELCLEFEVYPVTHIPPHLVQIGSMVTSQENACRYCYGATRAFMRMLGYSERFISRIEQATQLAELNPKESAFVEFCRGLARSRPRPAGAERHHLIELGYSELAVAEIAFLIAGGCMYNRVATFLACPPEESFERFVYGPVGRVMSLFGPVLRPMLLRKRQADAASLAAPEPGGRYGALVASLHGLPAAGILHRALEGAFASPVLPRRTKSLIFGVVARALDCRLCEGEARRLAGEEGLDGETFEATLVELDSPALERNEAEILAWARDTVHYEPRSIQRRTQALNERIGPDALTEAIGVASLANATVRMAMLLE